MELDVRASNGAAITLYDRAGFRHEGRIVATHRVDGEPDDLLIMALLWSES